MAHSLAADNNEEEEAVGTIVRKIVVGKKLAFITLLRGQWWTRERPTSASDEGSEAVAVDDGVLQSISPPETQELIEIVLSADFGPRESRNSLTYRIREVARPGDFLAAIVAKEVDSDGKQRRSRPGFPSFKLLDAKQHTPLPNPGQEWDKVFSDSIIARHSAYLRRQTSGSASLNDKQQLVAPSTSKQNPSCTKTGPTAGLLPVCRSWVYGCCEEGTHFRRHCKYRHYFLSPEEEAYHMKLKERAKEESERQREENVDPDDPHADKHGKAFSDRAFVDWLLSTYGRDFLSQGSGVIDVAGGRGRISFQLHCQERIACTLVDPRDVKQHRWQRKIVKKLQKEQERNAPSLTGSCFKGLPINEISQGSGAALKPMFLHIQRLFDEELFIDAEYRPVLEASSMVIGMHPDQATDAIVDFALAQKKAFAIVPCCVFTKLFPHRRTPEGLEVQTYQDLIAYLTNKHPSIRKAHLSSEGRNAILYLLPSDYDE